MTQLQTQNLEIQDFTLEDAAFIVQLLNDAAFLQFIGDKGVRTEDDARNYLREGPMASYAENGFGLMRVSDRASGQPIGMCGLLQRPGQPHPDIGFAFLPDSCGKGLAYESAMAVLQHGSETLGLATVDAFTNPDNVRSMRLLERCGLEFACMVTLAGIENEQRLYRIQLSSDA